MCRLINPERSAARPTSSQTLKYKIVQNVVAISFIVSIVGSVRYSARLRILCNLYIYVFRSNCRIKTLIISPAQLQVILKQCLMDLRAMNSHTVLKGAWSQFWKSFIFIFLLFIMLLKCISKDQPHSECQSKRNKQYADLTILCHLIK